MDQRDCGKTAQAQAADHAELNPGTTKVRTLGGVVLWERPTNKGMNQLDTPYANFDVSMVTRLIEAGFKDGYDGVKTKYIDGSPMALSQALGIRQRTSDDENKKLKDAHDGN